MNHEISHSYLPYCIERQIGAYEETDSWTPEDDAARIAATRAIGRRELEELKEQCASEMGLDERIEFLMKAAMTDHDLRRGRQEREALRQELETAKPLHYFGKYNGPEVDLLARISEAGQPRGVTTGGLARGCRWNLARRSGSFSCTPSGTRGPTKRPTLQ
ncbi:hypothetical protein [Antrihabitans stalactiti]|uniref:Uncharacterized protein n=1 Tax=Antrihabitans stalactiti TaxID=2584121 RepID=A0A848KNF7_9NOCA|nr:hypothetical protein [Antrihabitans stalactiti]NMN97840.1 hypothetical protein [Antrihabitans stalactiti]